MAIPILLEETFVVRNNKLENTYFVNQYYLTNFKNNVHMITLTLSSFYENEKNIIKISYSKVISETEVQEKENLNQFIKECLNHHEFFICFDSDKYEDIKINVELTIWNLDYIYELHSDCPELPSFITRSEYLKLDKQTRKNYFCDFEKLIKKANEFIDFDIKNRRTR